MQLDPLEQKRGFTWFVGAGLLALCLCIFLARVDVSLTYSTAEQTRGAQMNELRLAANSLRSVGAPLELPATEVAPEIATAEIATTEIATLEGEGVPEVEAEASH